MTLSIHYIFQQLSSAFTVGDVMVKAEELVRCNDNEEAKKWFDEFDVVPYPKQDKISGYFQKNSKPYKSISTDQVLSENTGILDLPSLLVRRKFYFVLSANQISGYVHYSDLNNSLVKLPYFILFEAVERLLWPKLNQLTQEEDLPEVFGKDKAKKFIGRRRKAEKLNIDVYWIGIFSFRDILELSRHYKLCNLSTSEIDTLNNIRNKVAHSDKPLVSHYNDVKLLVRAKDIFNQILEGWH